MSNEKAERADALAAKILIIILFAISCFATDLLLEAFPGRFGVTNSFGSFR
jgi:hypothetical protein